MAITKPLIIDKSKIDWDTLELLEDISARMQSGEQPKVRELKRLVAGVFVDWTLEDAGKITSEEAPAVFEAIKNGMTVPKASASDSSAPSTTEA